MAVSSTKSVDFLSPFGFRCSHNIKAHLCVRIICRIVIHFACSSLNQFNKDVIFIQCYPVLLCIITPDNNTIPFKLVVDAVAVKQSV